MKGKKPIFKEKGNMKEIYILQFTAQDSILHIAITISHLTVLLSLS